jgi:hypothetical protein
LYGIGDGVGWVGGGGGVVKAITRTASAVKKNIKNSKKIRTLKVFLKLIRTSKVTKIEVDQNVRSDNNHQIDQNIEN